MNPPGIYDSDSSGFYFIPTYDPAAPTSTSGPPSRIRAPSWAMRDPGALSPALHRQPSGKRDPAGAPGRSLRGGVGSLYRGDAHADRVLPENSASQGQVLRLSRYRAARIGVDVNLHTGRFSFETRSAISWRRGPRSGSGRGRGGGGGLRSDQKITTWWGSGRS